MRKIMMISMVFLGVLFPFKAAAQAQELQQLALNIEKLAQFRQILKDMKKGYEILTKGYNTVKDLTKGNFTLHQTFLDALLQVSPEVRNYKRVADIIDYQLVLVQDYRAALQRFRSGDHFNSDELVYIEGVYDTLLKASLRNLEELTNVITANKLRMSDDERLAEIDRIYLEMQDKLMFLRDFNNSTALLAVQRAKERHDVDNMGRLYQPNN